MLRRVWVGSWGLLALGCASTVGGAHSDVDASTVTDAGGDARSSVDPVRALGVGVNGACVVTDSGALWCWGQPAEGRHDGEVGSYRAQRIDEVRGAVEVSAFLEAAVVLLADGDVSGWGFSHHGQLGEAVRYGETTAAVVPLPGIHGVTQVSAGHHHVCAVSAARAVTCWGGPYLAGLGVPGVRETRTPVTPSVDDVVEVSASNESVCARRVNGEVWCWGDGYSDRPARVDGVTDAAQVSAGWSHACAARANGALVCWGDNDHGQLGDGTATRHRAPVSVLGLDRVVRVAAGYDNTCALRDDGSVWCAGTFDGGNTTSAGRFRAVEGIGPATAIGVGGWQACAVTRDRGVWCWGRIGIATFDAPVRVEGLP